MIRHKHDTILGDIPNDWEPQPLRSLLADDLSGDWGDDEGEVMVDVLRSTNFTDSGNLKLDDIAKRGFTRTKAEKIQVLAHDILLERSGGGPNQPVGRVAMIREEMPATGFANFVQTLRPNSERVNPEFLLWTLHQLNRSGLVEKLQHQTTQMRNLDLRDYLKVRIPVPKNPDEQTRIAEALKAADDHIRAIQKQICKAKRVKKALLQSLFIRGIPRFGHKLKIENGVEFPSRWKLYQLRQLLVQMEYGISAAFGDKGAHQILRMENVTNGSIHADSPVYINLSDSDYDRYRIHRGDILFNRTNSWDLVGRVGIAEDDMNAVFASYLVRLKTNTKLVNPFFLNHALNSPFVKRRYRRFVTPAVSQANINVRNLGQTWIAIPELGPSNEQDEIVEILNAPDAAIIALTNQLTAARRVKQSLLQNLLVGRIRLKA